MDLTMILMLGGLLLVMYFVMIRPQKKQEKEQNAMRNNLAVGDEITTIGGIIGKIVNIFKTPNFFSCSCRKKQEKHDLRLHFFAFCDIL